MGVQFNSTFVPLRSPLGVDLRIIFSVEGKPDLYNEQFDYVRSVLFLSCCCGCRSLDTLSVMVKNNFPDLSSEYRKLWTYELITVPNLREILERDTVAGLTALCANIGIKPEKKRKADIVNQLIRQCPSDALAEYEKANTFIKPSAGGVTALRSLYNERVGVELTVIDAMRNKDLNAVEAATELYNARRPLTPYARDSAVLDHIELGPAFSTALAHAYLCGSLNTTPLCVAQYQECYDKHPDAVRYTFGDLPWPVNPTETIPENLLQDIAESRAAANHRQTLARFASTGIRKAEWMAVYGCCDACRKFDGHIFSLVEATHAPVHARCGVWNASFEQR